MTRIGITILQRQMYHQFCSLAGNRFDLQTAANGVEALVHAGDSEAAVAPFGTERFRAEAAAIVADRTAQGAVFFLGGDPNVLVSGMSNDIVQGLLNDAIDGRLGGRGQAVGKFGEHVNSDVGALGYAIGKEANGGNPAKIVEQGGPKLVRVLAKLAFGAVEELLDLNHLSLFFVG